MSNIRGTLYWKLYAKLIPICIRLFSYFPKDKHKIVFLHNMGRGYEDSPKYIAEEITRRFLPYNMVWPGNDISFPIPFPIHKVRLSRIRSIYEFATAKVIVTTVKGRFPLKKTKSQFIVYIPHGQIGAKYVERQAGNNLSKAYQDGSIWHSSVCDLFVSSSKIHTDEMHTWYWYDGEIWESGLPRNDIFFNHTTGDVSQIKQQVNLPEDVKIAFYAPTFRDNGDDSPYAIDTQRLLQTLEKKTGNKWILLIRMHPNFIWYKVPAFEYSEMVRNVTNYPDMQELLLISDLLITDYSSTMFDFHLMHRPIFLFTQDIEDYQRMRGLKDWFFKVPFPFCHSK